MQQTHRPAIFLKWFNDWPISYQTTELRVKVVNFNDCERPPKLIGYPSKVF